MSGIAEARRQGLATNPAVPAALLRRLVTGAAEDVLRRLTQRRQWTEEQFETLLAHPDPAVRQALARAAHLDPQRRARLVEDPDRRVLSALVDDVSGPLPPAAYERLLERHPHARHLLADHPAVTEAVLDRLGLSRGKPRAEPPLTRTRAEQLAGHDDTSVRARAAADPRLPADLVARLATDPAPGVRLAVSMRQELSEQQRAAIDYQVRPYDRIRPARWAYETKDPHEQRRCVTSAHAGLRRSITYNPHLSPELVAEIAAEDDEVIRLLLVENQPAAPPETVLWVYARHLAITHTWLPDHAALAGYPFARLADDPFPRLRALVTRDPATAPEVVERLSHDPDLSVRAAMARDGRLSTARVLEMFEDETTAEGAAANPRLPVPVMESIPRSP